MKKKRIIREHQAQLFNIEEEIVEEPIPFGISKLQEARVLPAR